MSLDSTLSVRLKVSHNAGFRLDVSFEVPPGITILFGPSGAGKSTTLSAIAGLERPQEGRISLGAELWFDSATRVELPVHQRGIAFVFQGLALFPHMTALGNVEYGLSRKLSRIERRRQAQEWLSQMKVSHLGARRPASFSGGEAQRVALARAFATSPRLVLLDEAFSSLDRTLRLELASEVKRYAKQRSLPVIQVTHDREEAQAMGDRMILVEEGRVQGVGDVTSLLTSV